MLFNSYVFIFVFLPIVLLGFHFIGTLKRTTLTLSWLLAASLFFYGYWNPAYLALILFSIVFNFGVGRKVALAPSKILLSFGILVNVSLLGYFKYTNFFIDNFNLLLTDPLYIRPIILPLAISFFTFQQIAYLVDSYSQKTEESNFLHYSLFVTFFPQLIAGPIVHHKELLSQFKDKISHTLRASNLAVGLTLFGLGLFKKVVLADTIGVYANTVFAAAELGTSLTIFESWGGALAYTFQLYFDFSGYSDMAMGLARLFGIILPLNFYSPYKSRNIIQFWRRWHITLSRFLKAYIYIPLGGNRKGSARRYINLMITMLIGGIWHGAGWTFLLWGALHGFFLSLNHVWQTVFNRFSISVSGIVATVLGLASQGLTFFCVLVSWVLFRAETLTGIKSMYASMFGYNGISLSPRFESFFSGLDIPSQIVFKGMFYNKCFGIDSTTTGVQLLFIFSGIVFLLPNTMQWMSRENPALDLNMFLKSPPRRLIWKRSFISVFILAILITFAIMSIQKESSFLYFQF